ncbi:hypothetical protein C8R44DRAFT_724639 [Mycena epipterygia]|nr:hypothetical protein C8R44DRAFT_724639 [Mycena epipterygia]
MPAENRTKLTRISHIVVFKLNLDYCLYSMSYSIVCDSPDLGDFGRRLIYHAPLFSHGIAARRRQSASGSAVIEVHTGQEVLSAKISRAAHLPARYDDDAALNINLKQKDTRIEGCNAMQSVVANRIRIRYERGAWSVMPPVGGVTKIASPVWLQASVGVNVQVERRQLKLGSVNLALVGVMSMYDLTAL